MPTIQSFPLGAYVIKAAFLSDRPAFALGDGTVSVVDGAGSEKIRMHGGGMLAAATSWNGERLVTTGDAGRVVAIDAASGVTEIAVQPRKWIDQVACGPDGIIAYASGRQAFVQFADGKSRVLEHERGVGGLAFAPKGLRLAVARYNGVSPWWVGTDAKAISLEWKGSHLGASWSPDGKFVVTTMQENALHGWRAADGGGHMRMSGYPGKVKSISWSAKGRFLATSGAEMAVLWPFHFKDGPTGKPPLQLGTRDQVVTFVACHPSEEVVAIGYKDGMVLAVRFADLDEVILRKPGDGPVSALEWDKKGFRLAFGTEQGEAGVIDLRG